MHPVEHIQEHVRSIQNLIDEHTDQMSDSVVKMLSDALMKLHQEASDWYAWHGESELSPMQRWLRGEITSDALWEAERRRRLGHRAASVSVAAGAAP